MSSLSLLLSKKRLCFTGLDPDAESRKTMKFQENTTMKKKEKFTQIGAYATAFPISK